MNSLRERESPLHQRSVTDHGADAAKGRVAAVPHPEPFGPVAVGHGALLFAVKVLDPNDRYTFKHHEILERRNPRC